MAVIPGSVRVGGFIAPSDSTDTYATQSEEWGRGGWRTVADITARNAITADRRKIGMLVRVLDAGSGSEKFYTLVGGITDDKWTEQNFGGGSGTIDVDKNGTLVGTRPEINLIEGTNVTLTVADNPGDGRVDITVAATGSAPANMATFPTADAYIYVRSDGNDSNDGTADNSGHALLTIQAAIDKLDKVVSTKTQVIKVGAGDFAGFVSGVVAGSTIPGMVTYGLVNHPGNGRVEIVGTMVAATLSQGAVTGTPGSSGLNSDNMIYINKPVGADDWIASEVRGKTFAITGGKGITYYSGYHIVECTGSQLVLGDNINPYECPYDGTTTFEIQDYATRLVSGPPSFPYAIVFSADSRTLLLNKLEIYGPTPEAYISGIFTYPRGGTQNLIVHQVRFRGAGTNALATAIGFVSAGTVNISRVCLQKVGFYGGQGIYGYCQGGEVSIDGLSVLDPMSGLMGMYLYCPSFSLLSSYYVNGGRCALRLLGSEPVPLGPAVLKNCTGEAAVFATDSPVHLIPYYVIISGCTYGIDFYNSALAGKSCIVTTNGPLTINNSTNDAIRVKDTIIEDNGAAIAGTGNGGYGINAVYGSSVSVGGSTTITGTSGNMKIGDLVVPYTDLAASGDHVVDLAKDCFSRRK